MPPIVEDQIFPTLLAFKEALREWAVEKNFTASFALPCVISRLINLGSPTF